MQELRLAIDCCPDRKAQKRLNAIHLLHCGWLRENRDLDLSYPTLVRYLHEQDYARRIPRPVPEPPDRDLWERQREVFADELLGLLSDPSVKTLFGDEAGFEGDPRPRQRWVKRGSRPTQPYYGGHIRQNVVGAVNPADGQLASHTTIRRSSRLS